MMLGLRKRQSSTTRYGCLTDGLFGRPTLWPQELRRLTSLSLTRDWHMIGRFHPVYPAESAAVRLRDRLGDRQLAAWGGGAAEANWSVSVLLSPPPRMKITSLKSVLIDSVKLPVYYNNN